MASQIEMVPLHRQDDMSFQEIKMHMAILDSLQRESEKSEDIKSSKDFDDYQVFMRAMGVALSSMPPSDDEFQIYCVGPHKTNDMAAGFSNLQ